MCQFLWVCVKSGFGHQNISVPRIIKMHVYGIGIDECKLHLMKILDRKIKSKKKVENYISPALLTKDDSI